MRDIVERNLEVAAQCCLDINHRSISLTQASKPTNYYEVLLEMGELGGYTIKVCAEVSSAGRIR